MRPIKSAELDAMEARADAATPPPWVARTEYPHICWQEGDDDGSHILSANLSERPQQDIAFVAHARQDMPRLINAVRDYQDRFAAYAERLRVAIDLLNEDHRHSRTAGENLLGSLLDSLNAEAS